MKHERRGFGERHRLPTKVIDGRYCGGSARLRFSAYISHPMQTPSSPKPGESPEVTPGTSIKEWFRDFMNLREGSDREGAVQSITSGKLMRGSNAWMLVCSIMIASLGLNLDSGAVIIGAMLISPLMNPILGVGLGIGTNDRDMLWVALKNFGIAIAIALVTSIIYFAVTPIDTFTPQMQARTEPTILDALVAVFGGLAGIISVTRLDKTNAIPGVAIATALMPPLCVAGYGIVLTFTDVEQGLSVFWRAGYLFFLNSFFIAVTAYLIIRLLRFPYRTYVNRAEAGKSRMIIIAVSILMIIPGLYILRDVLGRQTAERAAREFTERYFPTSRSTYLLNLDNEDAPLLIYPVKDRLLDADSLNRYTELLRNDFGLRNARIVTDTSFTADEMAAIQGSMTSYGSRIALLERRQAEAAIRQENLARELNVLVRDSNRIAGIEERLRLAFPGVEQVEVARAFQDSTTAPPLVAVHRSWPGRRPGIRQLAGERQRMQRYLQSAFDVDTVLLFIEER